MEHRLLLTGAAGFVGGNIIREADTDWRIDGIDRISFDAPRSNVVSHVVDLLDRQAVRKVFETARPTAVVHTAAMSDIDYCEANTETARKINVGVTELLVDLCREYDAKIIYFSSDSVFDGAKGSYREDETPVPVNVYGSTKVESEHVVMNRAPLWVIVRPSLVMGLPVGELGNSFLWRMVGGLRKGEKVAFPRAEIRSPVDVITLSRSVLELAGRPMCGHFHLSGSDGMSRFEMAQRICDKLGYPRDLVVDKKPDIASGRAKRPANVTLSNEKAKLLLRTPMAGLDRGLDLIIEKKEDKEL
jgi:dTDP-4-dehydrorhamnose reductase